MSGLLLCLLLGCAGTRSQIDLAELQPWVGTWRGKELRENSSKPMELWTVTLRLKDNRLVGTIHGESGGLDNRKLKNVKVESGTLTFRVSYESRRGLQVDYHHRARLKGDKLLSEFKVMEGGRSFKGKWEARRIHFIGNATGQSSPN